MELKRILSVILIFSAASLPLKGEVSDKSGWEKVMDKNGVTIENRTVAGFKMKQLRARCVVNAPIEVIYEVMDDADSYKEWFGDCILQKDIKRINENEKICYHVIDVPWPLSDRDAVAMVTTNADWKSGSVEYRVDSLRNPEDSKWGMDCVTIENGRVRMPVMDGVFTFSRVSPDKSKFSYVAIADPGIPLPGWVLNMFSTTQPYNTLVNIREQVKKAVYWEKAGKRHNKKFTPPVSDK